jgi:transcriptional regulator with XRE-family HTH domain
VTSQTFGQTLREARVREGLSRLELAQMVGVTRTAVEYWENDKYPYRHNFLSLVQLFPALARFDSEIVKVRKSKEPLSLPTTEIVEAVKSPPPPVPEAQSDFIPNYIQIVALGEKLAEVQTGPSYNLILGALRQAKELQLDLDLLIELLESR